MNSFIYILTNNSYFQEGTNLSIKRDFTLRELIPFKITLMEMVRQMSLRYDANEEEVPKQVALEPKITNMVSKIETKNLKQNCVHDKYYTLNFLFIQFSVMS